MIGASPTVNRFAFFSARLIPAAECVAFVYTSLQYGGPAGRRAITRFYTFLGYPKTLTSKDIIMSFGIKTKSFYGSALTDNTCPTCNASSLSNVGILRHFHVFGLPLFPVGGRSLVSCGSCTYTQPFKDMPESVRSQASAAVNFKSMVLSSWGLLVVIAVLIGAFVLMQNDKRENQAYIAAPQAGDVYVIRLNEVFPGLGDSTFPYGVLQVTGVRGESIDVKIANAGYGNLKSVNKSLRQDGTQADFYSSDTLSLPVSALPALLEAGAIHDVRRK
jgi:hypothetical protein